MSPSNRRFSRRRLLETVGLAGSAFLAGCSTSPASVSTTTSTSTATNATASTSSSTCAVTPEDRTGVYASKGQNTTSNNGDNVFADGTQYELASLSGDSSSGFAAMLTIGVSA